MLHVDDRRRRVARGPRRVLRPPAGRARGVRRSTARRLGEVTGLVHGGAQDLLTRPHARRPRRAGAVREGAGARGRPRRRPGRHRRPSRPGHAGCPTRRPDPCGSTSSRSSPTTSRRCELSLAGKARDKGLLDVHVHDLRQLDPRPAPHRRRHAVRRRRRHGDEARAVGRGARRAAARRRDPRRADAVRGAVHPGAGPRAGRRASTWCSPAAATRASTSGWSTTRATRAEVREISIGDYVLNGGEVAALAITEAVVRLLPGFMGNPESLLEESHEDGLLEYPVYTKPASWRGLDVPPVLLSGDHAAIAAWRHEQAVRRTAERRPDLAHRVDAARRRRGAAGRAGRRGGAARPPAGLLGPGAARQPRRPDPGAARSRSTTCGPGSRGTWCSSRGRPAGWSARSGRRLRRRRVGHRPADGRPRPRRAAGSAATLLARIEAAAPPEATTYALFTGAGSAAQPADVQEGRLPAARRARARGRPDDQDGAPRLAACRISSDFGPVGAAVADLLLGPVGQTRIAPRTSSDGGPRRFLPQGEHDAAGQTQHRWATTERHTRFRG